MYTYIIQLLINLYHIWAVNKYTYIVPVNKYIIQKELTCISKSYSSWYTYIIQNKLICISKLYRNWSPQLGTIGGEQSSTCLFSARLYQTYTPLLQHGFLLSLLPFYILSPLLLNINVSRASSQLLKYLFKTHAIFLLSSKKDNGGKKSTLSLYLNRNPSRWTHLHDFMSSKRVYFNVPLLPTSHNETITGNKLCTWPWRPHAPQFPC